MGNHRSVRARSGWRRIAILGAGLGITCATVAGVGIASGTTTPTPSVYSSVAPVTVLGRSLAPHSTTDVTIAGAGSVPSNATSVQLSVTALSGTSTSSMYVYPTGGTQPTSANVRWLTGETVTIPVTVAVGTAGKVRLTTDGGTVTVKVAVVGYFSPAPEPGSTGYAAQADGVEIAEGVGTTIASLTVPAGTYEVQVTATMSTDSTMADHDFCYIFDPAGNAVASLDAVVNTTTDEIPASMAGLDTTSGGAMAFQCSSANGHSGAEKVDLVAIKLSAANGVVTGG